MRRMGLSFAAVGANARAGVVAVATSASLIAIAAVAMPPAAAQPSEYQYVHTVSGKVRCVIHADEVACERNSADGFPGAPASADGGNWNLAIITAGGDFRWAEGNIGMGDDELTLEYGRAFQFHGWTVSSGFTGTRLTNDGSGHGMFVSIDGVSHY